MVDHGTRFINSFNETTYSNLNNTAVNFQTKLHSLELLVNFFQSDVEVAVIQEGVSRQIFEYSYTLYFNYWSFEIYLIEGIIIYRPINQVNRLRKLKISRQEAIIQ